MVCPTVGQAVDQPGVAVIRKDDRLVGREEGVEFLIRQAVGMLFSCLQLHQVHDVDDPNLEIGHVRAQDAHGSERFQGGSVATAGHHHIRLTPLIVARPLPDPDADGAVLDGSIHVEVLQRGLFPRHDDVDIVATAQAVVGLGEQSVGIGGEVHPNHLGLFIDHMIDKPGVLMRKPVVILPPDVRRQQIVEGGNGSAPRDSAVSGLEPLGMLVEHRVHDMDKGLVGGEEPMATSQEVPLEPALAGMFTEDLHHPPVESKVPVLVLVRRETVSHPCPTRHLE